VYLLFMMLSALYARTAPDVFVMVIAAVFSLASATLAVIASCVRANQKEEGN
jgi:hypothetical protein